MSGKEMSCEALRDRVVRAMDHRQAPEQVQGVSEHVTSCPDCAQWVEGARRYQGIPSAWDGNDQAAAPSSTEADDAWSRLQRRVAREMPEASYLVGVERLAQAAGSPQSQARAEDGSPIHEDNRGQWSARVMLLSGGELLLLISAAEDEGPLPRRDVILELAGATGETLEASTDDTGLVRFVSRRLGLGEGHLLRVDGFTGVVTL